MFCICPMGSQRECPDDCEYAIWEGLTLEERRDPAKRQPIVERLYNKKYTQEEIARRLGISQRTVSNDLKFSKNAKLKREKTASNPKGAGRPPGPGKPRYSSGPPPEPKPEPPPEPPLDSFEDLPEEIQQRIRAYTERLKRKLEKEYYDRLSEEIESMKKHVKGLEELEEKIYVRPGLMTTETYNKIIKCLYPDTVKNRTWEEFNEASQLFIELKINFLDQKEYPIPFRIFKPRRNGRRP